MTTLENIHDVIENKIEISLKLFELLSDKLVSSAIVGDYIFRKNLNSLNENKSNIQYVIDDYNISSAYFIFSYNKIVIMEELENRPESYKNLEQYSRYIQEIDDLFMKTSVSELVNIFKNNSYEYRCSKTVGNKLFYGISSFGKNKVRLKKLYEEYKTFVIRCNIVDLLDRFVNNIHCFFKVYIAGDTAISDIGSDLDTSYFLELVDRYNKLGFAIVKDDSEIVYDVCDCGNKMTIQSNTSELLCVRCGYTVYLIGSVTEENQLFAQEGNRVSHGSYDPARHCKFWIERIQAKESTIIPDEYIEKIRKSIKKDRIDNVKSITVKQFRAYLKQNNLSKLNDHIPLIKKIITGYIPPQLNYNEQQLLFIYFDKATKTYEKIKPANKKNSLYYPFLIYKILDMIIKDESKKSKLLACIHLQSYDTLIDNDRIWHSICQYNSCFEYKATDKINTHF